MDNVWILKITDITQFSGYNSSTNRGLPTLMLTNKGRGKETHTQLYNSIISLVVLETILQEKKCLTTKTSSAMSFLFLSPSPLQCSHYLMNSQ